MRERGPGFRERTRSLAAAVSRYRLTMLAYGCGGALMAHVGAFGTERVPALVRFPYFVGLCLAGGLFASAAAAALNRRAWFTSRPVAQLAAQAAMVTVLLTPLVWIAAAWLLDGDTSPLRMLDLVGQVAPATALFAPVTLLVPRQAPASPLPADESRSDAAASLWAMLPVGLRTATIHAVEGHDHYLRVHTDRGPALVSLRLCEAVTSLTGLDGAQTHRSWWVARAAVLGSKRGRGRAVLRLCNGLTVPVSRTYAPALRKAGWF